MTLLEDAIDAHGGLARWREIRSIDVSLRCGGIAMPLKGQPTVLRQFTATVDPRRPHVELHSIGTFDSSVPRPAGMARRLRWSTDDVVHFAGYALWGYLAAPFVFADPDVTVRELPGRRLRVDFPAAIDIRKAGNGSSCADLVLGLLGLEGLPAWTSFMTTVLIS